MTCSAFWGKGKRAILKQKIALLEHQPQDISSELGSRISAKAMALERDPHISDFHSLWDYSSGLLLTKKKRPINLAPLSYQLLLLLVAAYHIPHTGR